MSCTHGQIILSVICPAYFLRADGVPPTGMLPVHGASSTVVCNASRMLFKDYPAAALIQAHAPNWLTLPRHAEEEQAEDEMESEDPLVLRPDNWAADAPWHLCANHSDPVGVS